MNSRRRDLPLLVAQIRSRACLSHVTYKPELPKCRGVEIILNMATATHDDIIRLFPGMQDHTAVAILGMEATVDELEAALQLLQDDDEGLIDIKQKKGDRLNLLLGILQKSEVQPRDDFER